MNNKWRLESGKCVLDCQGTRVRLRALDADHTPQLTNTAELPPFALHEWADYRVVAESSIADRVSVWVNQQRLKRDPDGPFWSCVFQNQIGKSVIQVALDGRPLPPLTVEAQLTHITPVGGWTSPRPRGMVLDSPVKGMVCPPTTTSDRTETDHAIWN